MNEIKTAQKVIEALDLELSMGSLSLTEPLSVNLLGLSVEDMGRVIEWVGNNEHRIPSRMLYLCFDGFVEEENAEEEMKKVGVFLNALYQKSVLHYYNERGELRSDDR